MSNQPIALRLAGELRCVTKYSDSEHWDILDAAAAELRRLHAENESLRQIVEDFPPIEAELQEVSDRAHRVAAQRDALLEALKWIARVNAMDYEYQEKARAAIKSTEAPCAASGCNYPQGECLGVCRA